MGVVALLSGCGDCGNEVLAELPAPSGSYRAVVFQRDCGATTGFSTQLSLLRPTEQAVRGGNVFVADTDHGRAPAGPGGGPRIAVEWRGGDTLIVRHHPNARLFRAESVHATITVRYVPDLRE
jgi:hypothetical protein